MTKTILELLQIISEKEISLIVGEGLNDVLFETIINYLWMIGRCENTGALIYCNEFQCKMKT